MYIFDNVFDFAVQTKADLVLSYILNVISLGTVPANKQNLHDNRLEHSVGQDSGMFFKTAVTSKNKHIQDITNNKTLD